MYDLCHGTGVRRNRATGSSVFAVSCRSAERCNYVPQKRSPRIKSLDVTVPKGAKNGASLEVMATCAPLPEMVGYDELFVTSIGFQFLFWSFCMTMFTGQTGLGEGLINEQWNLKFQAANTSSTRGGVIV